MRHDPAIAKITPPRVAKVVARERLFSRLEAAAQARMVWVSAPPGAGKTVLAASYLAARRSTPLWYQIDEDDADPASFFYYLALAARNVAPRRRMPLPFLTPEYRGGLPIFARRFFERLCAQLRGPVCLVLDDYQELPASALLHTLLVHGADALPDSARMVVLSRADPPPVFARLRASGKLAVIESGALLFTPPECAELLRLRNGREAPAPAVSATLHAQTEGWAAGLVLLAEQQARSAGARAVRVNGDARTLFDYFAVEVLRNEPAELRRFLMVTAVPPSFTAELAEALTGNRQTAAILDRLLHGNFFTFHLPGPSAEWRYHTLFREFLLGRAREELGAEAIADLQRQAAGLLATAGRFEDAAALCIESEDWPGLSGILRASAPQLAASGRLDTLGEWLHALPPAVLEADPWLVFWRGIAMAPTDFHGSRQLLESAYERFAEADDPAGLYPCWAAIAESYLAEWDVVSPLRGWVDKLEALRRRHPDFPSVELEVRIVAAMLNYISMVDPRHPQQQAWVDRARDIALRAEHLGHRIVMAGALTFRTFWYGLDRDLNFDFADSRALAAELRGAPLIAITHHQSRAMYRLMRMEVAQALKEANRGLAIAQRNGLEHHKMVLFHVSLNAALADGDAKEAQRLADQLARFVHPARRVASSLHEYSVARIAFLKGDAVAALSALRRGRQLVEGFGGVGPQVLHTWGFAITLTELGRLGEAVRHLRENRRHVRRYNQWTARFQGLLHHAGFALVRGHRERAARLVTEAFRMGRERAYYYLEWWNPSWLARLCLLAIEHGAERDYAAELIRLYRLAPPADRVPLAGWPWAMRLHTLGRFLVESELGDPAANGGNRPLELLKILVALGRDGLAVEQLQEHLWPDSEGDAAAKAFGITLFRLRKRIGQELLVLKDKRLRLDLSRCWVDAWAFDDLLVAAENHGHPDPAEQRLLLARATELYRGPFLVSEPDAGWLIDARERLGARFVRALLHLCDLLEADGDREEAAMRLEQGLEAAPVAEVLYQRLMTCQHALGRHADVEATYRRCRRLLDTHLGVAPADETERLYRELSGRA